MPGACRLISREQLEAAGAGHLDVEDGDVDGAAPHPVEHPVAAVVDLDVDAPPAEHLGEDRRERHLVVDQQDREAAHGVPPWGCAPAGAGGSDTVNVVPSPTTLDTSIRPPSSWTRPWQIARPSPVP